MYKALSFAAGCTLASGSLNLLIVGDWGGMSIPPYTTPGQKQTSDAMGVVASQISASAVLGLGDNFYFNGILTDDNSHRFEDTWNSIYSAPSLQVPWYLLAGNHDHYGNVTAQVEYTNDNDRWNFPSLFYNQSFVSDDGTTLDIIFIDTVELSGNTVGQETDPGYYAKLPYKPRSEAENQWEWIEEQLAASTADHLLVAGHFPVYSICEHGNTGNLQDNLKPLLIKYGAHYVSGHDHCLESIKGENDIMYIVTGIGNTCCTEEENLADVPAEYLQFSVSKSSRKEILGGFNSLTATKESMSFTFYDQHANVLFVTENIPARVKL